MVRGIPEGEYHHHEHYEPHDHEDGEGDRDGHGHCGHGGDAVHRADDDKVHRAYERKGSRNTEETHTSAGDALFAALPTYFGRLRRVWCVGEGRGRGRGVGIVSLSSLFFSFWVVFVIRLRFTLHDSIIWVPHP